VEEERFLAETTATQEALKALPTLAEELDTDPAVTERMRQEYETHLLVVRAGGGETDASDKADVLRHDRHYTALRLALLAHKRATLVRLRDDREIDDTVLRHVQRHLDIEEVRLSRRQAAE
jgi:CPA1 family monovalent cation:H+ antiporter